MSPRVVLCLLGMALLVQVQSTQSATTVKPDATTASKATTAATTPSKATTAATTTAKPTTKPATTTAKPTTKPATTTAKPTTKPATTTAKPTTKPATTTAKPTTKPATTTAKPTTKPATTTAKPTTKPGTTTTKPATTTAKPTTKPGTTTTKPTKPATTPATKPTKPATTAAKPTTKPTPAPVPVPHFAVVDANNMTCIILDAFVSLATRGHGKHHHMHSFDNSTVYGMCNETYSEIDLEDGDKTLQLVFHTDAETQSWSLAEVSLVENMTVVADGTTKLMAHNNESYECGDMKVELHGNKKHFGFLSLRDMRVQPFDVDNNEFSSQVRSCPNAKPSTNNTVPIAVGVALAGLVVCVIVAYVIGRSRSSRRGYQAV